ncbi:MAG: chorismate mutase [candidate division KSB1 bacterium]|nr:chorismate mutase [candidate division KSB1 bacterium]
MRQPNECKNMEDVWNEIDNIDLQIIRLISKRGEYVHAASKFKKSQIEVRAENRVKSMLRKRRDWAENEHIEPDVVEKLFSSLVDYFIAKEMNYWKEDN